MEERGRIPKGLDILLTHSPPKGVGDLTMFGVKAGCPDLQTRLVQLQDEAPKVHCFGHIHEDYGVFQVQAALTLERLYSDPQRVELQPEASAGQPAAGV